MSLSRAFTTRRLRLSNDLADAPSTPRRNSTTKGPILRHKISAPIQLIHTTNMLSYNVPDLPRPSRSDSTNSKSDEESDAPTVAESTSPTSPEAAPGERSPSPEPNHLTSYVKNPAKSLEAEAPPPAIPKRSPSHTNNNSFDAIARSRSVSRGSRDLELSLSMRPGQSFSRSPSSSTSASSASRASTPLAQKQNTPLPALPGQPAPATSFPPKDSHPFGQELAQVTELAEEYNVGKRLATIDEEQQYLDARGLVKLSVDDYLGAIQTISAAFFPEQNHAAPAAPLWI